VRQTTIASTDIAGRRVHKDHPRVEAYGSVEELGAFVGAVRTGLPLDGAVPTAFREELQAELRGIHSRLFELGRALSAAPGAPLALPSTASLGVLEQSIRAMEQVLPQPAGSVLPGGSPTSVRLSMCWALCRRAERCVAALARLEPVPDEIATYLDRLAHWLETAARRVTAAAGQADWIAEPMAAARG
jgi:cob(I)alamin adenosyltransferase